MPDALTYEQLLVLVGELSARVAGQDRIIGEQADWTVPDLVDTWS